MLRLICMSYYFFKLTGSNITKFSDQLISVPDELFKLLRPSSFISNLIFRYFYRYLQFVCLSSD